MYNFTELQQITDNRWQAHYHGNYGIYTVKIEFDAGGKCKNFSCTCPSDGYPCKHIGMLQTEINQQFAKSADDCNKSGLTVENILQNVSLDELRNFIVKKAKFNSDLTKAIKLEFADKLKKLTNEKDSVNIYKSLVCSDLNKIEFDEEDCYDRYNYEYEAVDLSILDEWYDKAKSFIAQKKYDDAVQVCQAVIEEYAEWCEETDSDIRDYIYTDYQNEFFDLLTEIANNEYIDKHSLFNYCKHELAETKYSAETRGLFGNLMAKLANAVNPDEFVTLQKEMLQNLDDKSSYEATNIVGRLHSFYLSNNKNSKAEALVEDNLQIPKFRKMAIEKRIAEQRFTEAKNLIADYLKTHTYSYRKNEWNEYLLKIAQCEKDSPTVRSLSFEFIEPGFNEKDYKIYKSTFSAEEWTTEFEKLYQHYDKNRYLRHNIPKLLAAEDLTEKLLGYCETNLSIEIMEGYYNYISKKYPQKTLELFKQAVDSYAEKNVGDKHYDAVCCWLKTMRKINGGEHVVRQMIDNYLIIYKRRPNMVKLLKRL